MVISINGAELIGYSYKKIWNWLLSYSIHNNKNIFLILGYIKIFLKRTNGTNLKENIDKLDNIQFTSSSHQTSHESEEESLKEVIGGPVSTEVISVLHPSGPSWWSLLVNNRLQAGAFTEVAHSLLSSNDWGGSRGRFRIYKSMDGENVRGHPRSGAISLRVSLIMKSLI